MFELVIWSFCYDWSFDFVPSFQIGDPFIYTIGDPEMQWQIDLTALEMTQDSPDGCVLLGSYQFVEDGYNVPINGYFTILPGGICPQCWGIGGYSYRFISDDEL